MDIKEILKHCDHTLLSPTATREDILRLLDEGLKYGVASVCIPPSYVGCAKEYLRGRLAICTVIGFPLGYTSTEAKLCETMAALADGADEIDMVINISRLKSGEYDYVEEEIRKIKQAMGNKLLKVIVETCLLTEEEKIRMCKIVTAAGADYIKTSTGFSSRGATREDIRLFSSHIGEGVKIKAAGGISTLKDAEDFLALGAARLGTSRIVKLAMGLPGGGY